jgi:hypothetical protein
MWIYELRILQTSFPEKLLELWRSRDLLRELLLSLSRVRLRFSVLEITVFWTSPRNRLEDVWIRRWFVFQPLPSDGTDGFDRQLSEIRMKNPESLFGGFVIRKFTWDFILIGSWFEIFPSGPKDGAISSRLSSTRGWSLVTDHPGARTDSKDWVFPRPGLKDCKRLVWITLVFTWVLPLVLGLDAWVFSLHPSPGGFYKAVSKDGQLLVIKSAPKTLWSLKENNNKSPYRLWVKDEEILTHHL